jgi:hypothetical protein
MLKALPTRGIAMQSLTLSSDTAGYSIAGGSYSVATAITLTINSGILLRPSSTYALQITGSFPAGSTLRIVNNGVIMGNAGNGGNGSDCGQYNTATAGSSGGDAVLFNYSNLGSVGIDNSNGYILGGGGGGGGGCRAWSPFDIPHSAAGGGGGGGCGWNNGNGGNAGTVNNAGYQSSPPDDGNDATESKQSMVYGRGGTGELMTGGQYYGGWGGDGGDFGQAGEQGDTRTDFHRAGDGANGGAAGRAIRLTAGSVSWLGGNNSSQVKGAVS